MDSANTAHVFADWTIDFKITVLHLAMPPQGPLKPKKICMHSRSQPHLTQRVCTQTSSPGSSANTWVGLRSIPFSLPGLPPRSSDGNILNSGSTLPSKDGNILKSRDAPVPTPPEHPRQPPSIAGYLSRDCNNLTNESCWQLLQGGGPKSDLPTGPTCKPICRLINPTALICKFWNWGQTWRSRFANYGRWQIIAGWICKLSD